MLFHASAFSAAISSAVFSRAFSTLGRSLRRGRSPTKVVNMSGLRTRSPNFSRSLSTCVFSTRARMFEELGGSSRLVVRSHGMKMTFPAGLKYRLQADDSSILVIRRETVSSISEQCLLAEAFLRGIGVSSYLQRLICRSSEPGCYLRVRNGRPRLSSMGYEQRFVSLSCLHGSRWL